MAANVMATCSTAQWSFNSENQSPCVVGSVLAGVCVGGDFTLTPLDTGFVYLGPSVAAATSCRCSSVYYSLLSACATCQNRNFITWSQYSTNCSTVYLDVFPQPIPAGVAVPHWAYLDVQTSDTFNVSLAQAAGGAESVAVPAGPSSTGRTTGASIVIPVPTGAATTGTKSHAGPIAGGVIGGIVGIALVGLIIFFLLRRNKARKTPPSAAYGVAINSPASPLPMSYGDGSSTYASMPSPKPYDPKDPATFPPNSLYTPPPNAPAQPNYPNNAPPNFGTGYAPALPPNATGQSSNSGYTQVNTLVGHPQYSGAPEL